jgi:hypothetical protein
MDSMSRRHVLFSLSAGPGCVMRRGSATVHPARAPGDRDRTGARRGPSRAERLDARTGRPAAAGQPDWPAYDLVRRPTMRIDTVCEVIYDRFAAEREMWKALGYIG